MSIYKNIAKGLASGKLGNLEFPTENIDRRRLTVDEIKGLVHEEFGKAKDVSKQTYQNKHFGDAELAKEIDWVKALDLREFFER